MNLKTTLKRKDLIYDVGLHVGQDTDFYLKKGFKVVAFEANPDNAEFSRKRFVKEIENKQLIIVEGAISENLTHETSPKTIPFYRNIDHSPWGSVNDEWAYRNEVMGTENELIEVKAIDFKQCLEEYGIPFYLKADIVGGEMICLRALLEFENKPDYISIRSEKVIFSKLLYEFSLLEKLGYDKFKAIQQEAKGVEFPIQLPSGEKIKYFFGEGASGFFAEETDGKWKNREQIIKKYQTIFVYYWLFGDFSYLIQTRKGRKLISQLERVFRCPLPGWYDTHAKHSSLD